MKRWAIVPILAAAAVLAGCRREAPAGRPLMIQLNWLHDPTFAGEYLLADASRGRVQIHEGGPNIFPLEEVRSGRADFAVVGADVFLRAISESPSVGADGELVCFFVDFQRNPVGWVMHPEAARRAGLTKAKAATPAELNRWLFDQLTRKLVRVGDKRGTETTSVWLQWKKIHKAGDSLTVEPVGFDNAIVLTAPLLAYPVYLNEEPFRLAARVGQPLVVFDPAADGIELYGNVLVATRRLAKANPEELGNIQRDLRSAWQRVKNDPVDAAQRVAAVYTGVERGVVEEQVAKTLEFVFFQNVLPGTMDLGDRGRWMKTLLSMQESGLVDPAVTLERLRKHLVPPA